MSKRYSLRMRIRLLAFGVLREHLAGAEQWIALPPGAQTVHHLLEHVASLSSEPARALLPRVAVAVNQHYANRAQALAEGDEVALLPPVSGGADPAQKEHAGTARVLLTEDALDGRAVETLKAGSDGAVVVFDGIVRNNTRGRQTEYLVYEAYAEMARAEMNVLVAKACERFAVRDVLLHHRLGRLEVGETSVLIAVASAHRGAAFDACRWIIDTLKQTVPIWKQEFFVDGAVWADGEAFPDELLP